MFDKDTLKNSLSTDDVYRLVDALGGEPRIQSFGLICATICHNAPGEGSHKLYYYDNTKLFRCYTDCGDTFDIYELVMRALNQQKGIELKLYQSFTFVANFFGYSYAQEKEEKDNPKDKEVFERYKAAQPILSSQKIDLPIYNPKVLKSLVYPRIIPWEKDGIAPKIIKEAKIGYYPVGEQITIPHFDKDGRFVGLRGRALITTEADNYGKYRPIKIDNILYTHPLGLNLYNLNHSKDNIAQLKKAIVFESEKSTLLYRTYFDYDISVACCGSSLSAAQVKLLMDCGAQEIIIAFDRQFKAISDNEFLRLKKHLLSIHKKYNSLVKITFIFDKKMITSYKAAPIDEGKEKFLTLFNERIVL